MGYPINLVTGSYGANHVTSADDGSLFAAIMGDGQYVLRGFDYEVVNNNTIRIKSGDLLINGRHAKINYGDSVNVNIDNGSVGMNRYDLIVATYRNNGGVESVDIDVIKGTAAAGTAPEPTYTRGNILEGDTFVQMLLFEVYVSGINIEFVEPMYDVTRSLLNVSNMIIPPVGWIEYNETGVNPSVRYPGTTWRLVGQGAVAACVDPYDDDLKKAGSIIGENKTRLLAENIPSHKHPIGSHTHLIGDHTHLVEGEADADKGHHSHRGFRVKDLASGTSKFRLATYSGDVNETSDITTAPYMQSKPADKNAFTGEHTHKVNISIESKSPSSSDSRTGSVYGSPYTDAFGAAEEFSTMQKTYLVYRWKRIS